MDSSPTREVPETDPFGYRMVFFLWFLFLFEPARLLAHYIPILEPLKWLPTILLLAAIFHWIRSPLRKYNYKWFTFFLIATFFGTVIAFVEGNWGIARQINRQIFQFHMLGIVTFTFFRDDERIKKLFLLYFLHIFYFAVWGIISLKVAPIDSSVDPGLRIIVPWHPSLDNRDGFGPLMVIGSAFSYYYFSAVENRKLKIISLLCFVLCLAGIVSSFGRGVFLALGITLICICLQAKRKFRGMLVILVCSGLIFLVVSIISPGDLYWDKMQTINEGTSEGTGADRAALWGFAWKVFVNNPIFGAGMGNFSISLLKLITREEASNYGYTQGRLWGRALHCAPLTILSEYGLIGSSIILFLILDFIKTNIENRRVAFADMRGRGDLNGDLAANVQAKMLYFISLGLMACFVAFWANGIFYEIIYTSFFWNIIVMNRLIYINQLKMRNFRFEFGAPHWSKV